jgi:hypothetical protein
MPSVNKYFGYLRIHIQERRKHQKEESNKIQDPARKGDTKEKINFVHAVHVESVVSKRKNKIVQSKKLM